MMTREGTNLTAKFYKIIQSFQSLCCNFPMRTETNSLLFPLVRNDATNATKFEMRKTENFSEENKIVNIQTFYVYSRAVQSLQY